MWRLVELEDLPEDVAKFCEGLRQNEPKKLFKQADTWPILGMSVLKSVGGVVLACSLKGDPDQYWENVPIPTELIAYAVNLLREELGPHIAPPGSAQINISVAGFIGDEAELASKIKEVLREGEAVSPNEPPQPKLSESAITHAVAYCRDVNTVKYPQLATYIQRAIDAEILKLRKEISDDAQGDKELL